MKKENTISVRIPTEKYFKLRIIARRKGCFISWVLDKAIDEFLKKVK